MALQQRTNSPKPLRNAALLVLGVLALALLSWIPNLAIDTSSASHFDLPLFFWRLMLIPAAIVGTFKVWLAWSVWPAAGGTPHSRH